MSGLEPDQVKTKMKKVKEVIDESLRIPGRSWETGDPDIPSAARTVRKLASEAGWDIDVVYARGITQTPKLVHMIAFRMMREHQRVTAIWEAPVIEGKLAWKFTYAGTLGGFIAGKESKVKPFPFTLSSDEMKGILKAEPICRLPLLDAQYETIMNEDKAKYFIPESEFRAPYKKVRAPKKTKAELIADDEMDMVLG